MFPVTIVYVENLECLGYCYNNVATELGDAGYKESVQEPENRIFAQFHKDYRN